MDKPIRTRKGLYTEETIEERDISITFACGDTYQGHGRLYWQRWQDDSGRIVQEWKRCDIEIPKGVANGDDVAYGNDPELIYEWSDVISTIETAIERIVKEIDTERRDYGYRCPDILEQLAEARN